MGPVSWVPRIVARSDPTSSRTVWTSSAHPSHVDTPSCGEWVRRTHAAPIEHDEPAERAETTKKTRVGGPLPPSVNGLSHRRHIDNVGRSLAEHLVGDAILAQRRVMSFRLVVHDHSLASTGPPRHLKWPKLQNVAPVIERDFCGSQDYPHGACRLWARTSCEHGHGHHRLWRKENTFGLSFKPGPVLGKMLCFPQQPVDLWDGFQTPPRRSNVWLTREKCGTPPSIGFFLTSRDDIRSRSSDDQRQLKRGPAGNGTERTHRNTHQIVGSTMALRWIFSSGSLN